MANPQDILDAIDELLTDPSTGRVYKKKVKPVKVIKKYEYQKSMLYVIQALTGQQTHEIIANLVEEADKHLADSGVDLTKKPEDNMRKDGWGYRNNERRCHKYMFYPGTELHLGIYVNYITYGARREGADAIVKYNFKLPSSSLKMDQKEYDDYITDGILCDASKDIEKPELKGTLTEEEREIKEKLRKEKAKQYAAKRKQYTKKRRRIR